MRSNTDIATARRLIWVDENLSKMAMGNPASLIRAGRGRHVLFYPLFKEYGRHLQTDEDY
jgi:hypothetical protein